MYPRFGDGCAHYNARPNFISKGEMLFPDARPHPAFLVSPKSKAPDAVRITFAHSPPG
jgi:hypothetical protein